MIVNTERIYPGGSKKRVTRAGDAIRSDTATPDDIAVIEKWRAAHRGVLNTFQAILRTRTRGQKSLLRNATSEEIPFLTSCNGYLECSLHAWMMSPDVGLSLKI